MIEDVFCKIIAGELPADKVYEDDEFLVIKDIHPQAPVHLLIIPKKHVFGMNDATAEILGKAMMIADKAAQEVGVHETGYRLILNEGEHAGKLVPHLHIHLIAGKRLGAKVVG
ncbi:MAG TPA: histidine triad nucleotide-binding protein [Candidatus Paceibacterota bacterium]|nr:histidine triad nucleotide-binding protein [Candidatus Paceibacterota bacterium]